MWSVYSVRVLPEPLWVNICFTLFYFVAMKKLDEETIIVFKINSKRRFEGEIVSDNDIIDKALDFAYEMCFGKGHHRDHRSDGTHNRKAGEIFCNTFQGKLAEACLCTVLQKKGVECHEPNFDVHGKGVWDNFDLNIGDKYLSVKSTKFYSNLLLLEKRDYNSLGDYLPNASLKNKKDYNYIILVRINPILDSIFGEKRLLKSDYIKRETIEEIIGAETWKFDIAGWVTKDEVRQAIKNGQFLSKGKLLQNINTSMDADNYYIQTGDMHNLDELIKELKNK